MHSLLTFGLTAKNFGDANVMILPFLKAFIFSPKCQKRLLLFEYNPEGSSLPWLRLFDKYLTLMIAGDDSFGQAQSQPPPSFLGGKPGLENLSHILLGYTFSGI